MTMKRNKLYSLLFIACLTGYIWLIYSITSYKADIKTVEVCLIKQLTNVPCPSCGSTRSIISLTKGNFVDAIHLNPLGYIVALIMLIAPVWIITDMILVNDSLFRYYNKIENHLKRPKYSIPLILLIVINWIWNITKSL